MSSHETSTSTRRAGARFMARDAARASSPAARRLPAVAYVWLAAAVTAGSLGCEARFREPEIVGTEAEIAKIPKDIKGAKRPKTTTGKGGKGGELAPGGTRKGERAKAPAGTKGEHSDAEPDEAPAETAAHEPDEVEEADNNF